jgi:hypothetical protein
MGTTKRHVPLHCCQDNSPAVQEYLFRAVPNFTLVLNKMRNGNQPALSSVAALWQSIDALALQRLDLLLSMEAGAMGVTKDTLMHELYLAGLSSPNAV